MTGPRVDDEIALGRDGADDAPHDWTPRRRAKPLQPVMRPDPDDDGMTPGARLERLQSSVNMLAATIAQTEQLLQRRAELLQRPEITRGAVHDGSARHSEVISLSEASRRTGRHPEVLRRWCTDGRIPAIRVGRTWALTPETVNDLIVHSARSRPRLPTPGSA